jgi:hypothetical protein
VDELTNLVRILSIQETNTHGKPQESSLLLTKGEVRLGHEERPGRPAETSAKG